MIQEEVPAKINIQLQFRSKVPLSDQVRKGIFDLIQRGELPEGIPLPTVRELAAQLGINFNTVARAYRVLDQEGWLMTRQGRGTIVTKPSRDMEMDRYAVVLAQLAEAVQGAAKSLELEPVEILQALTDRFSPKQPPERKQAKRRRRKTNANFRAYHPALPRSRKTRRETLDWRLRKPAR